MPVLYSARVATAFAVRPGTSYLRCRVPTYATAGHTPSPEHDDRVRCFLLSSGVSHARSMECATPPANACQLLLSSRHWHHRWHSRAGHTGIGLTVHLRGRMWMYFFKSCTRAHAGHAFGAAHYIGLVAAALFAMLLAFQTIGRSAALGTARWKSLQRWALCGFRTYARPQHSCFMGRKRNTDWHLVLFFADGGHACSAVTGIRAKTQLGEIAITCPVSRLRMELYLSK